MATPFFFETSDGRRLFAISESPSATNADGIGIVFCPAFAEERQKLYRSLFHFSRLLRDQGIPSIRFDYLGTGDSEGTMQDISLARMLSDTIEVVEYANRSLNFRSPIMLGTRLGAVVAARATSMLASVENCILWNPIICGTDYLRALKRTQKLIRMSRLQNSPPQIMPPDGEALTVIEGDLMTPQMVSQLEATDLRQESLAVSNLLVTGRRDDKKERRMIEAFIDHQSGGPVHVEAWFGQPREYWSTRSMYDAYFPGPTFKKTLEWLTLQQARRNAA